MPHVPIPLSTKYHPLTLKPPPPRWEHLSKLNQRLTSGSVQLPFPPVRMLVNRWLSSAPQSKNAVCALQINSSYFLFPWTNPAEMSR